MSDDTPPGWPKGRVPIIGEVVGDGEVRARQGGNRPMSKEEMEAAFGKHPRADWRYVPTKKAKWWEPD